jgi:hypothetical protein
MLGPFDRLESLVPELCYDFQRRTVLELKDGTFVPKKNVTDDERGE